MIVNQIQSLDTNLQTVIHQTNYVNILCNDGSPVNEDIYAFVSGKSGRYQIETLNSNVDTVIELRHCNAENDQSLLAYCEDDGGEGSASKLVLDLVKDHTYFLSIEHFASNDE